MRDFNLLKLFALFKLRIKHYPLYAVFLLTSFTFLTFLTFLPLQSVYAAMGDYCVVPPYVKRDVSVNIMVLMDNSTDMKNSAYSHDSDTDYADSAYTPNATYDNYYGYFDPRGCYAPPGTATPNFKYVGAVDYTNYPPPDYRGCPPPGSGFNTYGMKLVNGNVLNWITMSRLSVMKKVIMGGKFEPRPDTPQRIVFEGSDWIGGSAGCKWTITGGTTLTVSDKGVPDPCSVFPKGTWPNIKIDITPGIEDIRGVFQDFVDKYTYDNSYNNLTSETPDGKYDKNAPRFGLTDFSAGGVAVIDQTIPQDNPINSYFTSVQNAVNRDLSPLATAHKAIIDYFDNESPTTGTDPYKSCVSYEKPCMSPAPCRKSYILMITSGGDVTGDTVATLPAQCSAGEARPLVRNACYAYNTDLRTAADLSGKQNLETYVIQTFGAGTSDCSSATGNIKALCDAAAQGGGNYYSAGSDNLADTIRKALQDIIKRAAAGTAASVLASGEGSGANLIQAVFYPRAMTIPKGGIFGTEIDWIGRMTNYWYYVDPFFAASSIYEDQASASVNTLDLTDDNKIQLYFDVSTERTKARRWYDNSTPKDGVPETAISPDIEFEKLSSIWEAGVKLWERTSARTIKTWLDSNNNGVVDSGEFIDFSTTNAATLWPYLNLTTVATDDLNSSGAVTVDDATRLIEYIHGADFANLRSRTTAIDLNNDGDTSDTVNGVSESAKVWKLGDVLNSTPKVSSWIPLNSYHEKYTDTTYGDSSTGGYINTANYKNRGMVFAGANDGMLHAFKLGKFELKWSGQGNYQKARLRRTCLLNPATSCSADATCSAAGDRCPQLGEEMWSFIPKNVLPYLKYLTDPGYCHVYSIDLTPFTFDASINKPAACGAGTDYWDCTKTTDSWRTILIGGMRFGGACRNSTTTCTDVSGDAAKDCVNTPVADNGYSSYFALDVTDQNNPTLLWEFSNENLGFTTGGPAVVRISARVNPADLSSLPDSTKNGKWFVVFGSGPTGPISTTDQQFMGRSDQNLKLFVLDLKTGALLRTIDTTIQNAFAGSMLNATVDPDSVPNYQDNVVYIPYVKRTGTSPSFTWTDGGIGRLVTSEYIDPSDLTKWKWSTVMDNIGPVTSSVANLINKSRGELWLYFGSGRYYFEQGVNTDDAAGQRQIFGIKEPCYSGGVFGSTCITSSSFCTTPTTSLTCGGLTNVTDIANVPSDPTAAGYNGWYINLDPANSPTNAFTDCAGGSVTCPANQYGYCEGNPATFVCRDYRAERIITDPLTTTTGLAFFTAYKPYKDECTFGGKSAIWATKYDTGGAPGTLLKGMALVQVSTGAIEQVDLSKVFTQAGGRKSTVLEGVPPTAQGLSIQSTPNPVKRILHIRQR